MQPPGLGERGLLFPQAFRQLGEQCDRNSQVARDRRRLDGDRLERALAADPARRRGVEVALEPGWVEGVGLDLDRVRSQVGRRRGSAGVDALGEQKPEGKLLVVDLERLFNRDRVLLPSLARQPDHVDRSSRVRRGLHRGSLGSPASRARRSQVLRKSHTSVTAASQTRALSEATLTAGGGWFPSPPKGGAVGLQRPRPTRTLLTADWALRAGTHRGFGTP